MKNYRLLLLAKSIILLLFLAGCTPSEENNPESPDNPLNIVDSSIDEEAGTQTLTLSVSPTLSVKTSSMFSNARVAGDASGAFDFDLYQAYIVVEEVESGEPVSPAILEKPVKYVDGWDDISLRVPLYTDIVITTYIVHKDFDIETSNPHTGLWDDFSPNATDMVFFAGQTDVIATPVATDVELAVYSQVSIVDVVLEGTNTNINGDNLEITVETPDIEGGESTIEDISLTQTEADNNQNRFYFAEYLIDGEIALVRNIKVYHDHDADEAFDIFLVGKSNAVFESGKINTLTVKLPSDYNQGAFITLDNDFSEQNPIDVDDTSEPPVGESEIPEL